MKRGVAYLCCRCINHWGERLQEVRLRSESSWRIQTLGTSESSSLWRLWRSERLRTVRTTARGTDRRCQGWGCWRTTNTLWSNLNCGGAVEPVRRTCQSSYCNVLITHQLYSLVSRMTSPVPRCQGSDRILKERWFGSKERRNEGHRRASNRMTCKLHFYCFRTSFRNRPVELFYGLFGLRS